jgi:hypothetical protein
MLPSSASYAEYLVKSVASVAINNVPTSSMGEESFSKVAIWTVGPSSTWQLSASTANLDKT